jgi:hypothetical protein
VGQLNVVAQRGLKKQRPKLNKGDCIRGIKPRPGNGDVKWGM